jgi:predicted kinase
MDAPAPVFVIIGQLSAGKSTVARALLDRYPFGYLIDVDEIREMVTSGLASPLEWNAETSRQFSLAICAAAALARLYAHAGFAVAIEGAVDPELAEAALKEHGLLDRMVGIVLHPRLNVALERNRTRRTKAFETSILEGTMRQIEDDVARNAARAGWHEIDNSDDTVDSTVDRILAYRP